MTSPKSRSLEAPRDTTLEKPIPSGVAQSRSAVQIAPDCEMSASEPALAFPMANVAFNPMAVRRIEHLVRALHAFGAALGEPAADHDRVADAFAATFFDDAGHERGGR